MLQAADTFGSYGVGPTGIASRAVRAADRAVTLVIALVLFLALALSGYSMWDTWRTLEGGDQLAKPDTAAELAALMAENPDVVGWLTVDGTKIDYPVVQGKDNFEYLSRDAKGQPAAAGSIFLDAACDRTFHEPYEVIMGHHMARSKMFGDLDKFLKEGFFRENGSAQLMLADRTLELRAVAVLKADAYDGTVFGTPAGSDRVSTLVDYVAQHATFAHEGSFGADDQLIALSTCGSDGLNERTIVLFKVAGERPAKAE